MKLLLEPSLAPSSVESSAGVDSGAAEVNAASSEDILSQVTVIRWFEDLMRGFVDVMCVYSSALMTVWTSVMKRQIMAWGGSGHCNQRVHCSLPMWLTVCQRPLSNFHFYWEALMMKSLRIQKG
jgi:hypothetical protein